MGAIANDWLVPLSAEFKKPYYASLYKKVVEEYTTHVVYPPSDEIFTAFNLTPLSKFRLLWSTFIKNCTKIWAAIFRTMDIW